MSERSGTAPLDLAAIRARAEAARRGEWLHVQRLDGRGEVHYDTVLIGDSESQETAPLAYDADGKEADFVEADAVFVAHAHSDVPALVAEVERLRAGLRDARRAGAFFRSCAAGGESIETAEAYEMLDLLVRKEVP